MGDKKIRDGPKIKNGLHDPFLVSQSRGSPRYLCNG